MNIYQQYRNRLQTGFKHWLSATVIVSVMSTALAIELTAPVAVNAQPSAALGAWTQQWSDEFNGAGAVSGSNWLYDLGHGYGCGSCGNWGTGEIENMTNSTANVNQTGGHLAITPIRDGSGNWTSGRIETQRTDFQPPAGGGMAIEASIQQPNVSGAAAQGYWPAFWSLGAPFRGVYTNWPSVGEIDILEDINGQSNVFGTLHCGVSPGGPCNETTGIGSGAHACPGCQTGYHTYRFEFDKSVSPQQMRWYLDGSQYWTVNANQVDATTWSNATNHGFFLILNVAIGGGWPGNPTGSTASGVPMNIDYVRVFYANAAGGATPTRTNTPSGPTPTRTNTPSGPTPTKTNTPSGPTPTKTNTPVSGADHGVDNVSANQARPWYKCTITCSYVIVHYIVPGQVQQNVYTTYNSGLARWEYLITGITAGQVLQYQFTYNDGVQHDTAWFTWTKP
jgi:beta-glucanase (GH16 family)